MQRLVGDVANGYPPVASMLDAFQGVCTCLNMTNLLKFVGRTLNLKLFRIDINFKANIFVGNKHPYKCLVPASPKKSPVNFLLENLISLF